MVRDGDPESPTLSIEDLKVFLAEVGVWWGVDDEIFQIVPDEGDSRLGKVPIKGICYCVRCRTKSEGQHRVNVHLAVPCHSLERPVLRVNGYEPICRLNINFANSDPTPDCDMSNAISSTVV